jgi:hypothetical protein
MNTNYDYVPVNENNVSFAGTTENFIFTITPTYAGMIPVYEMPVAGSLDNSTQNSSAPGSLKLKEDK